MILGRRGMSAVHLVEGEREVGGHLRWLTKLPGCGDWWRVVDYRAEQLRGLRNVEVVCGTRLSAQDVLEYGADIIVLATGSHWARDGYGPDHRAALLGGKADFDVVGPEDILLEGKQVLREPAVVYDRDGYMVGSGVAEYLATEGVETILVTPHNVVGPLLDGTHEGQYVRERLQSLGVTVVRERTWTEVMEGAISVEGPLGEQDRINVGTLVPVTQRCSNDSLYGVLMASNGTGPSSSPIYRIGDCFAPRLLADAVFDAHRLAMEIDSENPVKWKPYRPDGPFISGLV